MAPARPRRRRPPRAGMYTCPVKREPWMMRIKRVAPVRRAGERCRGRMARCCAVQRHNDAEVSRARRRSIAWRRRPRRALHRASEGGAAAVLHLWGESVQHLWLIAEDRTWPAQPACSCARVAAIRCCCVPTAIAVSCIAAECARSRAAVSDDDRPPGATSAAGLVASSMPRAARAGANGDVRCVRAALAATSIK